MNTITKLAHVGLTVIIFAAARVADASQPTRPTPTPRPRPTIAPLAVSVNGNGQNNGGSIFEYLRVTAQTAQIVLASGLSRPRGVAFDGLGNLFVAVTTIDPNTGNFTGAIVKVFPNGGQTTFANVNGPSNNFFLSGLAMDNSDNVFVVAEDSNDLNLATTIYKFTPNAIQSTFGSLPGQGFGLTFDSAGNLLAADSVDQIIYEFTPDGTRSVLVGPSAFTPNTGPAGLAFDQSGNLFVSTEIVNNPSGHNDTILKFTPDGMETTFADGLNNPRGLAFDGGGNLFVAELFTNGSTGPGDILRFTPNGTRNVLASGLGSSGGPEYLTFPGPPGSLSSPAENAGAVDAAGNPVMHRRLSNYPPL